MNGCVPSALYVNKCSSTETLRIAAWTLKPISNLNKMITLKFIIHTYILRISIENLVNGGCY